MTGRYRRVQASHARRSFRWTSARRAGARSGAIGCSAIVAFIGFSWADTSQGPTEAGSVSAKEAPDTSRTSADLTSRHDRLSSDPVDPTKDPNQKPEAQVSLPGKSGEGRRIVFDIDAQQVWLVGRDDTVQRTYVVSGSRFDQLPTGTFEVYSKSRHTSSWSGGSTMEYMVRFFEGENAAIGFHDIPVKTGSGKEVQTLSELGTPLSDGCIRQHEPDAKALWSFADVGTKVVVVRT